MVQKIPIDTSRYVEEILCLCETTSRRRFAKLCAFAWDNIFLFQESLHTELTDLHRICSACFCENLRCLRETITLRMVLCLPCLPCETMPTPQGISVNSCPFVAQKIPVDTRRYVEKSLYSEAILFPRLVILFPRHGILVTRYGICITKAWYFYYWHWNKFFSARK